MDTDDRVQTIVTWLKRIEESPLTVVDFFEKNAAVPFSRPQYYRYLKKAREGGEQALCARKHAGGNRKLSAEAEAFIAGCVGRDPHVSPLWLRAMLAEKYECFLSPSRMTRALNRLHPELEKRGRGRPRIDKREGEDNACGGFELIVALAYHLGWPQMTAGAVKEEVQRLKRRKAFRVSERYVDKRGRDEKGRFTSEYSRRVDVRESRFESISTRLLKEMVGFWQRCWALERNEVRDATMLCYYIDGNTNAVVFETG